MKRNQIDITDQSELKSLSKGTSQSAITSAETSFGKASCGWFGNRQIFNRWRHLANGNGTDSIVIIVLLEIETAVSQFKTKIS